MSSETHRHTTLNSHVRESYRILPVMLPAANEQVLGQRVLGDKVCPKNSETGPTKRWAPRREV